MKTTRVQKTCAWKRPDGWVVGFSYVSIGKSISKTITINNWSLNEDVNDTFCSSNQPCHKAHLFFLIANIHYYRHSWRVFWGRQPPTAFQLNQPRLQDNMFLLDELAKMLMDQEQKPYRDGFWHIFVRGKWVVFFVDLKFFKNPTDWISESSMFSFK